VAERFAPRPDHVLDQMVAVYDELLSTVAAGATARAPAGIEIHTAERSG